MRVSITTTVTAEQKLFVKSHGLKFSNILDEAINDKMKYASGEIMETNASLMAKIERLMSHISEYTDFINNNNLMDKFLESNKK